MLGALYKKAQWNP